MKQANVSQVETIQVKSRTYVESQPGLTPVMAQVADAAFMAGYDRRTDDLNRILFGDKPAFSAVECALKAYGAGMENGMATADEIISEFESFARKVHGLADGALKEEAAKMLLALEKSRNDDESESNLNPQ